MSISSRVATKWMKRQASEQDVDKIVEPIRKKYTQLHEQYKSAGSPYYEKIFDGKTIEGKVQELYTLAEQFKKAAKAKKTNEVPTHPDVKHILESYPELSVEEMEEIFEKLNHIGIGVQPLPPNWGDEEPIDPAAFIPFLPKGWDKR